MISPLRRFVALFLARCRNCNLVFDVRIPTRQELSAHYEKYSYSSLKQCPAATVSSYRRVLKTFEAYRVSGRILDVGCGQGDFLVEAGELGWTSYGTEYSPGAVGLCRARGLRVVGGEINRSIFEGLDFDVVTSFEVFEHINTANEQMAIIREKLRPGGLLYLTTPNWGAALRFVEGVGFKMICYPEHICFYTRLSISALARRHGFIVKSIAATGLDIGRLKSFLNRKKVKYEPVSRAVERSETQDFRSRIEGSAGLRILKRAADGVISLIGVGDTLKCRLEKRA
jgi:2-polyprenyl-3-methyl-5-hydroxy-6-metoxy-1,4-benzoquinol methylase